MLKGRLAGETTFDFNKLLRMPESLNIECRSRTDLGIACFAVVRVPGAYALVREGLPGCDDASPAEEAPGGEEAGGRRARQAGGREHPGSRQSDWYEWCSENWGTNWNAHNVEVVTDEPTTVAYKFHTAWCAPYPLTTDLRRLRRELDLELAWTAMDEDDTGTYDVLTGRVV
ncbi:hypothetical protein [Saccharomonospora piscinae]|uniref:hypothetical protein n=1 Tax=Saccharomonospora piscinae TaxID=687388 RepID=UPI0018CC4E69|nr:hypothetical protein [Saccharomonospora piscinae]